MRKRKQKENDKKLFPQKTNIVVLCLYDSNDNVNLQNEFSNYNKMSLKADCKPNNQTSYQKMEPFQN